MALYGRMTRDETLELEACKLYTKCLQFQHHIFRRAVAKSDVPLAFLTVTMSPYLLSVYETTAPTSANGWLYYLKAAFEMILYKGPEY